LTRILAGVQPVREAIRAHGSRVAWVCLERGVGRLSGLASFAEANQVPVRWVEKFELAELARGTYHQGAVCEAPPLTLTPLERISDGTRLILALDGVQDPQNFGATVRSAVGLANAAVLWGENASAPLTAAMSRASAGAVEHATLCRVPSLTTALEHLVASGFSVVGLDAHADVPLKDVNLSGPCVLVVGGEGRGLARQVRKTCTHLATLVQPQVIDSLNASVAAALALYEAQRQR
jgi:23S rRNA (guanosine2251-2'-O)-methyltransferase